MLHLTNLIKLKSQGHHEVMVGESFACEEVIQIKQRCCILNGFKIHTVVEEHLNVSDIQSSVACVNCLQNNLQNLSNEDIVPIQICLSKLLASGSVQYPPLLLGILQVIIDLHYKHTSNDDAVNHLYDYWTREITHVDNNIKSLKMVIGAICMENHIRLKRNFMENLNKWSEEIYIASQVIGAEHFKVAVGNCLKIAGHKVISMATDNQKFHPSSFLLIRSALNLIEDEDCDIRNMIVSFIVSMQWKTKAVQYQSIQFNTGCKMLYDLIKCNFWTSQHMIQSLFTMLYKSGEIQLCIERLHQRRQQLFEKDENNFFSERTISHSNVYSTLKLILQKHIENKTSFPEIDGGTVVSDLHILISAMNDIKTGKRVINRFNDSIILEKVTGLVLAAHFICLISTEKDWENLRNSIHNTLKNEVFPLSFRNMMSNLISGTS
ncbi:uncharacterized protein LOC127739236 [Mytilus californianus]|uniref:uncharacterized protein LOC127739236 n=1 Tax=Mytilus californianus TaxID=6549 RepID=UPI002248166C|nr:uncharacterized protein LOC127739236 [Mytilus californianus]